MFAFAIVRKPGSNFSDGITTADFGRADYEKALEQHKAYCEALVRCGLELIVLEPDLRHPDSTFVEDTAIITEKIAVITRPGDVRRLGEEVEIREVLSYHRALENIEPPGTVDGGDVLRINDHFHIGLSGRTNEEGARQFRSIVSEHGYTSSTISVRGVLHLKSGVNYIGNNNLVVIEKLAVLDEFRSYNKIVVAGHESYSANCLLVNEFLLVPKGCPSTGKKLRDMDYNILELEMSEFRKMDGGLTCLSLRF